MKTTIVIKRDGRKEDFNHNKIIGAISKANDKIKAKIPSETIEKIADMIELDLRGTETISVEDLQEMVMKYLKELGLTEALLEYREYSEYRRKIREEKSDLMRVIGKLGISTDRDNANVGNNFSAKLLRIASETNKRYNLSIIPKHLAKLHENGDYHIHDLDSYNLTINCLHVPTKKLLQRGFNTGYGTIRPPKHITSAADLSCIILQASQNDMFGGQSHPDFDNDLSEYVEITRQKIYEELNELGLTENIADIVEKKVEKEVRQAMQAIVYNLNTMHSRAGSQVPFSSLNIGIPKNEDAALICKIFLEEYRKGLGKGEQPIFPNIIYRLKNGINKNPGDKYYYLTKLAYEVAAERLNPTFLDIDKPDYLEAFNRGVIPAVMGCRTNILGNVNGEATPVGRGNIAPVTINLPRLAINAMLAYKDDQSKRIEYFYEKLDEMLELSKEQLMHRYEVLKKLKKKDLPFVLGEGLYLGSEELEDDDSIEPVLKQGTWAIGFIGLAETLVGLTGKHHGESTEVLDLGYAIVKRIRDYCDKQTSELKLNFTCYATPAEGLADRFTKIDRSIYGEIPGITDKGFYTNSYHVPVDYPISMFEKMEIEGKFHHLCNAGRISYIELDGEPSPEIIEEIVDHAFNSGVYYIGINYIMRYCKDCGKKISSGISKCDCGSTRIQGVSRVTGYLALDERFSSGKMKEKLMRVSHNTGRFVYRY